MQPYAQDYIAAGQKYNIDPALLAAITEEESGTSGTSYAFSNRCNAMGISRNDGGPRNFNSIDDSIEYAARILSNPNGAYANDLRSVSSVHLLSCRGKERPQRYE